MTRAGEMANAKTAAKHLEKGLHYLRQGLEEHPELEALEALCMHAEARTEILTPNTLGVYRQDYRAALAHLAEQTLANGEEIERGHARIVAALDRRRGKPAERRTSTRKVKDPQKWMVRAVFQHLKHKAVRYGRIRSVAVGLYCLLVPKLGVRSVELVGARLEGDHLVVKNAKGQSAAATERRIGIGNFHPTHREALRVLIEIVARDVGEVGYERWLGSLAEILARACGAASAPGLEIPRLAPSAFRHTALSTWHSAGYTAAEIARLAGHFSLITARRHYIRKSSAFPVGSDLAEPVEPAPPEKPAPPDSATSAEMKLVLEDMPQPVREEAPLVGGGMIWSEYVADLEARMPQIPRPTRRKDLELDNPTPHKK